MNDVEKIVVAKDVMTGLIEGLPKTISTGLISYGHRARGACDDIETIAAPGAASRTDLLGALAGITPQGKTPIAGSLLQAGELLLETENAVSVVLVSDGIESCEGDPCATAAQLRNQGIDVTIHVVGFDVDAEAEEQLSCIAENGGGEYYQAGSADALSAALADVRTSIVETAVVEQPEPVVTTLVSPIANVRLADDVLGIVDLVNADTGEQQSQLFKQQSHEIPPGSYRLEFKHFTSPPVSIVAGEEYLFSAADYGLSLIQLDGTQINVVAILDVSTGEELTSLTGQNSAQIPPGTYQFKFRNFTSPPLVVEPRQEYRISAEDYGLSRIKLDGTQIGVVDILDDSTGEKLTSLTGQNSARIPPGTYRFKFRNFLSPPLVVEPSQEYRVSAEDYGLSRIKLDGTQIGVVAILDDSTVEELTSLTGKSSAQLPPGTYRFRFRNFLSPPLIVDAGTEHIIVPANYGLATVSKARDVRSGLELLQDGERVLNLTGQSPQQIPSGVYTLVYQNAEIGEVTLTEGEVRVLNLE